MLQYPLFSVHIDFVSVLYSAGQPVYHMHA